MTLGKKSRLAIAVASFVGLSLTTAPSIASADQPSQKEPSQTQVEIRYDHPISLFDAITATASAYPSVIAYRFENEQVIGEYSPLSGSTPEQFVANFEAVLGTQPEVVAFILPVSDGTPVADVPAPDVSKIAQIDAPLVQESYFAERGTGYNPAASSSAPLSGSDWRPDLVQTRIEDMGSTIYFDYALFWDSPTTPGYIPSDYGMEVGVELYNGAGTALRPFCSSGYKDAFFAKNYGWNWYAVDETLGAVSAAQPYADYNDLSDECNRNSMQIGFATPQAIPVSFYNAPYDWVLFIWIEAPQGTQSSNVIGGDVALVTKDWCTAYPYYSWTDCMGVSAVGSPLTYQHRSILNVSRGWTAPDKCWTSDNKGTTAPYLTIPGGSTGCY
jgi:hypothetical protein